MGVAEWLAGLLDITVYELLAVVAIVSTLAALVVLYVQRFDDRDE